MNAYTIGQSVRLSVQFTDIEGAAYDPNTITITYKAEGQASVTKTYGVDAALMRDGIGEYHLDIVADRAGEWHYRAEGIGGGQATAEDAFYVSASEL